MSSKIESDLRHRSTALVFEWVHLHGGLPPPVQPDVILLQPTDVADRLSPHLPKRGERQLSLRLSHCNGPHSITLMTMTTTAALETRGKHERPGGSLTYEVDAVRQRSGSQRARVLGEALVEEVHYGPVPAGLWSRAPINEPVKVRWFLYRAEGRGSV